MTNIEITENQRRQVCEVLELRANEIARFSDGNRDKTPASVDVALHREIKRLRQLAEILRPTPIPEEE